MAIVVCGICAKKFYVKPSHQKLGWGKYCSIDCRSKAQFKGEDVSCHVCAKKIHRSPSDIEHSKSGNHFCSKSCQTLWRNKYFIGEKHKNWINGISIYREIMFRSGQEEICKICKTTDKRVLSVHHIDKNRGNNSLSNLVWLCFNCHYLVHHDKDTQKIDLQSL